MANLIIMPKLGFNMSEGRLVRWYKNEGDAIKKGEALFSVETDKTSIDIESTCDGYVRKLFIDEGDTLGVTLPIAIVGGKSESIDEIMKEALSQLGDKAEAVASGPMESAVVPLQEKEKTESSFGKRQMVSPRARKAAREKGIDLSVADIEGTGFSGGICEKDVLKYADAASEAKASPLAKAIASDKGINLLTIKGSGPGGKIMKDDLFAEESIDITSDGKEIRSTLPYSGVREIIGKRLSASKVSAPHVYFTQKVDMEELLRLRSQVNRTAGWKTSVTDYIIRAAVLAIKKYPGINASLIEDRIEEYSSVNVGIAVASPTGLIVPVVRNAEGMSINEISKVSFGLIEKARQGRLTPDEYNGGTFTVSNLGMFGIENFTAIINPPEAAILAVSATKDEPCVIEKQVLIKPMMNITLSADHRIIDGLLAARFVTEIKLFLENPVSLII